VLVCNVSLLRRRVAIAATLSEAAAALDDAGSGNVVFATLVDDPASVGETVDAYLGEIMLEAASADTILDANVPASYAATIAEATTATDLPDALKAIVSAVFDAATTIDTALSNGNLTATHTTTNANSGARVLPVISAGKFYFEITMVAGHGSFDAMGLASSGITYNNFVLSGTNSVVVAIGGGITINGGAALANIGAFAPNDILGIAVDLTAHLVWCRRNAGLWNNNAGADPATATGGFTVPAAAIAPCVCFVGGGTAINDAYTANFGATSYANAAPSGFGNWPP
jgi:uncharacterized protein YdbL (DUF1318 family)